MDETREDDRFCGKQAPYVFEESEIEGQRYNTYLVGVVVMLDPNRPIALNRASSTK